MDISPPQLLNTDVYVSGDVTIDPSAAIAPGVVLRADPEAQIVIGAGVCIGKEVILHAHQGILEIETGAILGAKVLVVGAGKIGENACIGSETTLLAIAIEPKQVIPPGSLIGDTSRVLPPEEPPKVESTVSEPQAAVVSTPEPVKPSFPEPEIPSVSKQETVKPVPPKPQVVPVSTPELVKPAFPNPYLIAVSKQETVKPAPPEPQVTPVSREENGEPDPPQVQEETPGQLEQPQPPMPPIIYGKDHLSQLLDSLLPHRKAFNSHQSSVTSDQLKGTG